MIAEYCIVMLQIQCTAEGERHPRKYKQSLAQVKMLKAEYFLLL
jgi:hypothetical protein